MAGAGAPQKGAITEAETAFPFPVALPSPRIRVMLREQVNVSRR